MTVAELIVALADRPKDLPVLFTDDRAQVYEVKDMSSGTVNEIKSGEKIACLFLWSNQSAAKEIDPPHGPEEG